MFINSTFFLVPIFPGKETTGRLGRSADRARYVQLVSLCPQSTLPWGWRTRADHECLTAAIVAGYTCGYDESTFFHWRIGPFSRAPNRGRCNDSYHRGIKNPTGYAGRDPDSGYRPRIDKATEISSPGYYAVTLTDYNIKAEITATTRTGFHRYTFSPIRHVKNTV